MIRVIRTLRARRMREWRTVIGLCALVVSVAGCSDADADSTPFIPPMTVPFGVSQAQGTEPDESIDPNATAAPLAETPLTVELLQLGAINYIADHLSFGETEPGTLAVDEGYSQALVRVTFRVPDDGVPVIFSGIAFTDPAGIDLGAGIPMFRYTGGRFAVGGGESRTPPVLYPGVPQVFEYVITIATSNLSRDASRTASAILTLSYADSYGSTPAATVAIDVPKAAGTPTPLGEFAPTTADSPGQDIVVGDATYTFDDIEYLGYESPDTVTGIPHGLFRVSGTVTNNGISAIDVNGIETTTGIELWDDVGSAFVIDGIPGDATSGNPGLTSMENWSTSTKMSLAPGLTKPVMLYFDVNLFTAFGSFNPFDASARHWAIVSLAPSSLDGPPNYGAPQVQPAIDTDVTIAFTTVADGSTSNGSS